MKIVNDTDWNTRDIRRLALRVAHVEQLPKERIRRTIVNVCHARFRRISCGEEERAIRLSPAGRGTLGGHEIWLYVDHKAFDPVYWAWVIAHELAHNQGIEHRHMGGRYYREDEWRWAAQLPVSRKPMKPKPGASDRWRKDLVRVDTSLRHWLRKRKLSETKVATLEKKRARLERRLVGIAQPVPVAKGFDEGSPERKGHGRREEDPQESRRPGWKDAICPALSR